MQVDDLSDMLNHLSRSDARVSSSPPKHVVGVVVITIPLPYSIVVRGHKPFWGGRKMHLGKKLKWPQGNRISKKQHLSSLLALGTASWTFSSLCLCVPFRCWWKTNWLPSRIHASCWLMCSSNTSEQRPPSRISRSFLPTTFEVLLRQRSPGAARSVSSRPPSPAMSSSKTNQFMNKNATTQSFYRNVPDTSKYIINSNDKYIALLPVIASSLAHQSLGLVFALYRRH